MKKILLRFLFIFFLISLVGFAVSPNFTFAQKELQVKYPEVEGFKPETTKTLLPDYVKYIFNFLIWASGFIASGALIYGGFKYLTSAGMPEKLKDAKEQIAAALLGLLILFASYLILITINPQLVIFHLGPLTPIISTLRSGVLVCKEPEKDDPPLEIIPAWNFINEAKDPGTSVERRREIRERLEAIMGNISKYCYYIESGGDVRKEFNNKIKYVYFIPKEEEGSLGKTYTIYGVVLYEDKDFKDRAKVVVYIGVGNKPSEEIINLNEIKTSSIRPFVFVKPEPDHKAVLYEEIDYNFGGVPDKRTISLILNTCTLVSFDFTPQSIEIIGDYIVILAEENNLGGETEVFIEPGDRNLNNNRVACWGFRCEWLGLKRWCKRSCVKSACTYGAKLY